MLFAFILSTTCRPEKFEIEMLERVKDLVKSVQRISGAGHMVRIFCYTLSKMPLTSLWCSYFMRTPKRVQQH